MEIMIVDDEPQVAEVLAKSLSRQGHRTTVLHSGEDALKAINTALADTPENVVKKLKALRSAGPTGAGACRAARPGCRGRPTSG